MENWQEDNLSAIQEYPFDFDRYIEERLREIEDLGERRFAKTILVEGSGKAIRSMEQRYKALERRIYEEIEIDTSQYGVVTTIVRQEHYDPTNDTLFPVIAADLDRVEQTEADEGRFFLGTIFLEAGEGRQREFEAIQSFTGLLDQEETFVYICPAKRYRDAVEELYRVFQDNHIPWETVNTAYLDRFYDVYAAADHPGAGRTVRKKEDLPGLSDVKIRYGGFEEEVRTDILPLWNIQWMTFDGMDFMLPCTDGKYYEHSFSLEGMAEGDGYLIQANEDILEIRHEEGKIVIKSERETFERWRAARIVQKPTERSYEYDSPLLTNHKKDSFIRRYAEHCRSRLMTKSDLFRRIMELDIGGYIEVVGYGVCDSMEEVLGREDAPVIDGGMDWFVADELFPMESRRILVLQFREKEPGYYLNGSMVRFVISQIQLEISGYRCVGVVL